MVRLLPKDFSSRSVNYSRSSLQKLTVANPPFSAIVSGWGAHVTKPAIKIVSWYAANGADKI